MNARRVARELAVLALTQFAGTDNLPEVNLEQILEQALRMLVSETESELQVAGASLEQADHRRQKTAGAAACDLQAQVSFSCTCKESPKRCRLIPVTFMSFPRSIRSCKSVVMRLCAPEFAGKTSRSIPGLDSENEKTTMLR